MNRGQLANYRLNFAASVVLAGTYRRRQRSPSDTPAARREAMTLILSLASASYSIQLSDRRLTSLAPANDDRQIITETANKAGVIEGCDARLAYAFTGLASTGAFDARQWLKTTLLKAGEESCGVERFVAEFAQLAEREFSENPAILALPPEQRRISVMLSGFWNTNAGELAAGWIVTNFQRGFDLGSPRPDSLAARPFVTWRWHQTPSSTEPYAHIERLGARGSVPQEDREALIKMLRERRPADAVIGKALKVFFRASGHPTAANTVGRAISIVVIPSGGGEGRFAAEADSVSNFAFVPDILFMRTPETRRWLTLEPIEKLDSGLTGPAIIPRVHPKQACPCGSGERYGSCHRRFRREIPRRHQAAARPGLRLQLEFPKAVQSP